MLFSEKGGKVLKYKDKKDIIRLIKSAAALKGATQGDIAEALGILQPSLSRTLNKTDLSFSTVARIAAALDCDLYIDIRPRKPGQDAPAIHDTI